MSVPHGAPGFWFVDLFLDEATLRYTNAFLPITFDGNSYTPIGDRMTPPADIDRTASLKSQKFSIDFDSSRQTDNSDEIGVILDSSWKRRPVRARYAVGDMDADGYDFSDPLIIADEAGRILNLPDTISAGDLPTIEMEIESGALIFLERRNQTRSPANQKAAFPGDLFFDLASQLDGVVLPWRTKKTKNGSTRIEYSVEGAPPREMIIGRAKTRGSFVFGATTNNHRVLWSQIYALADHQCDALEEIWINGTPVLNGTVLSHGVRTALNAFRSSESGAAGVRLFVTWYDGRHDQTADALLISETASQPLKWTANHRGRGVSYVKIEHIWDSDNPDSFSYEFLVRGAKIYQERKDSTAGGSGAHRIDSPATWEFTTNPEEALRHYLRGRVTAPGSSHMWFGVGAPLTFLDPYSVYSARAAHCDDLVPLKTFGSEKRYEANGRLSADADHGTNIKNLADCMVARAIDEGGRVSIRLSEPQTPVVELTDADLIEDEETEIDPNARGDDVINRVEGRFIDPLNKYDGVDYPAVSSDTFAEIDGESITETWNQDFEISIERAQRKATIFLNQRRRTVEMTERFGSRAWIVRPGDWVTRKSDLRGFPAGKLFIAEEVRRFVDGTVRLVLLEVDPAELVWSEESAQLADDAAPFEYEPIVIVALPVTIQPVSISNAEIILPGVQINRDDEDDLSFSIIVEIALDNGSGGPEGYRRSYTLPAKGQRGETIGGLLPSTDYVIRTRYTDGTYYTAWTPWQSFTTTDEFQAKTALEAAPESALAEALETAQAAREQIAELILSLQVRLDETRRNVSRLLTFNGVSLGSYLTNLRQRIEDSANEVGAAVISVSSRLDDAEADILETSNAITALGASTTTNYNFLAARINNAEGLIVNETSARVAADDALSSRITGVASRLVGVENGVTGNASALANMSTRVTKAENNFSALSGSFTALESKLEDVEGAVSGQSTALNSLSTRVSSVEGVNTSQANAIVALQAEIEGIDSNLSGFAEAISELQASVMEVGGAVEVDLSDITSLATQVSTLAGNLTGQAQALSALTVRVSATEGQITTLNTSVTSLTSTVSGLSGTLSGQVSAVSTLSTRITATETSISALSSQTVILSNELDSLTGDVSGFADAISELQAQVTALGGEITVDLSDITSLSGRIDDVEDDLTATGGALTALTTRVSTAETGISSLSSAVTSLTSTVGTLNGNLTGQATALTALTTRVTSAEGNIVSQASSLSALTASVGSLSATVSTTASALATLDGIVSAAWGLVLDVNGRVASIKAFNDGEESELAFTADSFKIFNGDSEQPVFEVADDTIFLNGVVVREIESQLFTGANTTLPSNATYGTILSGTIATPGAGPCEFEFEFDISNSITIGCEVQVMINGTVVRTTNHYCAGPFTHTLQAFARFTAEPGDSITVRARAQRSAGVGLSGVSITYITGRLIRFSE